ncbi:hypothetical protein [Chitinimonas lacunae]|uniref:HEAT repeat domain-containing protein n=1 Tax=Chitinimonas lacunae TaxID=1963018 RepID=A0ABV8MNU8_9NEIS
MSLALYEEIQLLYPHEPDWDAVPDAVLVELVEHYPEESSCATLALGILSYRRHSRVAELARWLLSQKDVDPWLRQNAQEVLLAMGNKVES